MTFVGGIDIGGTKCAVSIGKVTKDSVETIEKVKIPTPYEPLEAVAAMVDMLQELLLKHPECTLSAIGISCGSPLDSKKGVILSPPNLPNWDNIDVVTPFEQAFHVPAAVQNDANACALAEWIWGAGKGSRNMVFLTFGTGMGAGLILDGKLYVGTNDMAGEVGHIRLEKDGPIGYHKAGSFEGFCSGGGIAKLGISMVEQHLKKGGKTLLSTMKENVSELTAADMGQAAEKKDALALEIFHKVGIYLGTGLSILVDILNPEVIVIGSIFLRQEKLLRAPMEEVMKKEALDLSFSTCKVVPAGLGEMIGDYAAYSVAINLLREREEK